MSVYYNEFDPKAAAWLRELIAAGLIPGGEVDERSICDVQAGDIDGFIQCHFFAGIGGWPYALSLAGWPSDRPVWTMSCPCQPFSCAGKGLGASDERHLWPVAFNLIRQCKPVTVFGEQVANAISKGWLDGISADLESAGYACGATVLGAHSVGAPNIRQRLYWVAQSQSIQHDRRERNGDAARGDGFADGRKFSNRGGLAHSIESRLEGHARNERDRNEPGRDGAHQAGPVAQGGAVGGVDNSAIPRCETAQRDAEGNSRDETRLCVPGSGCADGFWSRYRIIPCRDGKARRIEPGTFPLVNGLPAGMVPGGDPSLSEVQATAEGRGMRLKGYGNAIVPQVAAEFIRAVKEVSV